MVYAPRYLTPLRYPGGKAKLAPFIAFLLKENHLLDGEYVEPYAGGASVAVALLAHECVSRVHINDIDRSVYAFWASVLYNTEALCRLIHDRPVSPAEWRRQRQVQERPYDADNLELGFSTFFLNRTNRSGIIWSGGMIGGKQQTGHWKLDARYNKADLIRRIERIAEYRDRVSLYNVDAAVLLRDLLLRLPRKVLLYLDPPYYVKGRRRLYANFYQHDDHAEIAKLIGSTDRPWLISYDDAQEVQQLYRDFPNVRYRLSYSAHYRYDGAEVIFFSKAIRMPRKNLQQLLKSPARIQCPRSSEW